MLVIFVLARKVVVYANPIIIPNKSYCAEKLKKNRPTKEAFRYIVRNRQRKAFLHQLS